MRGLQGPPKRGSGRGGERGLSKGISRQLLYTYKVICIIQTYNNMQGYIAIAMTINKDSYDLSSISSSHRSGAQKQGL